MQQLSMEFKKPELIKNLRAIAKLTKKKRLRVCMIMNARKRVQLHMIRRTGNIENL